MSRMIKSSQIIELAIMMQNSHYGISLEDIMETFECSKRTAQRMKSVVEDQFPFRVEEVENYNSRKKRWKLKKESALNSMVQFTSEEICTLARLRLNIKDRATYKILTNLISKLSLLVKNKDINF